LILANAYLFVFLLLKTPYFLTTAFVGIASLAQCALLIVSIDKVNRIWTHFFEAVRNADFTQNYALPGGASFNELKAEYATVMALLKKYSVDRETHHQYLQTITRNIGVGVAVLTHGGKIDFSNDAFSRMLGARAVRTLRDIERLDKDLCRTFTTAKNGDSQLFRLRLGDDWLQLIVSVTDFVLLQEKYRLVTIQDIRRELEDNEIDAWQNAARVLTHEIMNSITPISSLSSTARGILTRLCSGDAPVAEGARDVIDALQSIERRSRSLRSFVDNYRSVLAIPKPVLGTLLCSDVLSRLKTLMSGILKENRIDFQCRLEPRAMELTADKDLLEQVFINLITNSIEALGSTKKPAIKISAHMSKLNRPVIEIADNGHGISGELLDKVFVPFFTTKRQGSGIGLSLCRQIMRLHGGTISVFSDPGKRTVFSLRF
jgi:nitrogen fixation/metabolism regulation signal transduction histidine kinase